MQTYIYICRKLAAGEGGETGMEVEELSALALRIMKFLREKNEILQHGSNHEHVTHAGGTLSTPADGVIPYNCTHAQRTSAYSS